MPITNVPNNYQSLSYTGNGFARSFNISWPATDASAIVVSLNGERPPTIGYNLVFAENNASASLVFDRAPEAGAQVEVYRQHPRSRNFKYGTDGRDPRPEALNAEMALFYMLFQELEAGNEGALRLTGRQVEQRFYPYLPSLLNGRFLAGAQDGRSLEALTPAEVRQRLDFDTLIPVLPYATAQSIGLKGDGVADDWPALQKYLNATGGFIILESRTGKDFYFSGRLDIKRSGTAILWQSPARFSNNGGVKLCGRLAEPEGLAPLRLTANAMGGSTRLFLDTSPQGGGQVGSFFAVGDVVGARSRSYFGGKGEEQQYFRVTALNNSTNTIDIYPPTKFDLLVTYSDDLEAEYDVPDRTYVSRIPVARVAVGPSKGDNKVTIRADDVALIGAGDEVLIMSDATTNDGAWTDAERALVVGKSGSTLTLAEPLGRGSYSTLRNAVVARIDAVTNVQIAGCRASFGAEAHVAAPAHAFEAFMAATSRFEGLEYDGLENPCRGDAFRLNYCRNSSFTNSRAILSPSVAATRGLHSGYVDRNGSGNEARGLRVSGARYAALFGGATRGLVQDMTVEGLRFAGVGFEGAGEQGCLVRDVRVVGTGATPSDETGQNAIVAGDDRRLDAFAECTVEDVRVDGMGAPGCAVTRFGVGSINLTLRGIDALRPYTFLRFQSSTVKATGRAYRTVIEDVRVTECIGPVFDVNGLPPSGTVKQVVELEIRDTVVERCPDTGFFTQIDRLELEDVKVSRGTSTARTTALAFVDVSALSLIEVDARETLQGFSLTRCPAAMLIKPGFIKLGPGGRVLTDGGGNAGTSIADWMAVGFTPAWSRWGTGGSMDNTDWAPVAPGEAL